MPLTWAAGADAGVLAVGIGAAGDRGVVDCKADMPCDRSSSAIDLFVDYRLASGAEFRLGYVDAGRFRGSDVTPLGTPFGGTFRVGGITLAAGYRWAFAPAWSLEGHAGAMAARTRFSYADGAYDSVSKTVLEPLAGLGVDYALSPSVSLGLAYDATRFRVHTTRGTLQTLGLRAQYTF